MVGLVGCRSVDVLGLNFFSVSHGVKPEIEI